jgi:hypothetical protein
VSKQFASNTNRPFQFHKRSQLLVGVHNKAPSVAVRIDNPDRVAIGLREAEFPSLCVLYSATLSQ